MKSSGIGGQAVLEGVMMRNRDKYAVAVRKPDGEISVQNWDTGSVRDRHILLRLPIVRGVVAFIESLILGIKTLTYSSSFLEEDGEKAGQVEAVEISDRKELLENILIVALSILLAVGFFMILPFAVSELFRGKVHSQTTISVIEGILKVLLFLGYVVAISFLSDIKRTFMYHGAEHKTINCVENGLDLTVENVKKQSRYHRRCGTSFLLVVMIVSIVFFMFIRFDNLWIRMLYRILLIPVVAGVSFELIQFVGNTDNKLVLLISKPGLWLQKLTTREPDDGMIEVAIASVEAVFDWRAYQTELHKEKERRTRRKKKAEKRKQETTGKKEETAFVNENDETSDETGIVAAKPEKADETVWSRSGAVTKKQKKADGEKEAVTRKSEQTEAVPEQEESIELEKAAWKKEKESAELEKAARENKKESIELEKAARENKKESIELEKAARKKEKESAELEKAARENKKESIELEKAARKKKNESSKATKEKESNSGFWKKLPKSKKRRELEEREERYRNRAAERMRQIKEQEAREAAHEKAYQEAKKRRAERLAATQELPKLDEGRKAAPKVTVEQDADDLKSLDRFFDDKKK
jgi:uncharacterized protein YqhQ